jgi:hypothetical protein
VLGMVHFLNYGMVYDMIYSICVYMVYTVMYIYLQLGWHPVAAVQHTFIHKPYS